MKLKNHFSYDVLLISNDACDQLFQNIALNEVAPDVSISTVDSLDKAIDYIFNCDYLPDLILLNFNIGELKGKSFLGIINNYKSFNHVPIVVLSGIGCEEEALRFGARGFFRMPFHLKDLIQTMDKIKKTWLVPVEISSGNRQLKKKHLTKVSSHH